MILSTKGRYGLKAMFVLALHYGSGPVSLTTIAEAQELSVNYLEQLILPLKKNKLVESIRGAQGGYLLARAPKDITIGSILKTLEGPLTASECVSDDPGQCSNANYCVTRIIWEKITDSIDAVVESTTLQDMVDDHQKMRSKMKGESHA